MKVGIQLNDKKALLTPSYNSPMGLYSDQNIANTLVTTMEKLLFILSYVIRLKFWHEVELHDFCMINFFLIYLARWE